MTNPYAHSGMNTEKYLALATVRPEGITKQRQPRPTKEAAVKAKRASILERYK